MAGGYISCGTFYGDDKSGSAFLGLLEGIAERLPPTQAAEFRVTVIDPIMDTELPEEQALTLSAEVVAKLEGYLGAYYEYLGEQLGHPLPHEAPDLDQQAGLDPTEAKWGKGLGWKYYCAHDLLQACGESHRTGEPIILSFD
jgi:hypothetical protein